ncbi:mitochondrial small ribosomal subunit Rsm22-domain-containing protein [Auriculariales sp. MPI-PUGE-AT-0066]|nr:mitochondrial small ribosomal subunit Rsm22-domain-containing protein [Auriculariales sp. MPI-PUGE-AT-0066]
MRLARALRASSARLAQLRTMSTRRRPFPQEQDDVPPVQQQPNVTMENDPSLMLLLRDVDSAIKRSRRPPQNPATESPSNEHYDFPPQNAREAQYEDAEEPFEEDELEHEYGEFELQRKAPATVVGGIKAKALDLPFELVAQMEEILDATDRRQVRSDARRLYEREDASGESEWVTEDTQYKTRQQAVERSVRDGLAYSTVIMPKHYAGIYNVFQHIGQRFGPDFKPTNIVDMGSHVGEVLWAAREVFVENEKSRVLNYFGIDPRQRMVQMGTRLVQDIELYGCNASFHSKLSKAIPGGITPEMAKETMIVSAFDLSRHERWRDRRDRLYEMWQTGAETIVIIEEGTRPGYEFIAEAREYLLRLGITELQEMTNYASEGLSFGTPGLHAALPCPHDGACPLLPDYRMSCHFGQQFDPPSFSRQITKAYTGSHEMALHSYAVLRRGPRPKDPGTAYGRVGHVGRQAEEARKKKRVMHLVEQHEPGEKPLFIPQAGIQSTIDESATVEADMGIEELKAALRKEAIYWPRLNQPVLKKAGHIVLDACVANGSIERLTISKSRGKQEFYDARKSSWGDSFPHVPVIKPVLRYRALARQSHFDVDESILAVLDLATDQQARKKDAGKNKWNKNRDAEASKAESHEDRRLARKMSRKHTHHV